MEFGSSSRLPVGGDIVGASWTSATPSGDANLLIVTTESRIQIHAADDQRVVASWLTRPGAHNHFTVPAVQHRVWRQLFVVQNTNLFMFSERQNSLDTAVKVKLRSEAFSLRTSKHIPALVCVLKDGSVSVFNEKLTELFYAPADSGNRVATWSRLTSIPGQPGKCVLMVLTQSPMGTQSPLSPLLRVYTLSLVASTSGAEPTLQFKFSTTHTLQHPEVEVASGSPYITSISLHKNLQQLGVFWSSGTMQMMAFRREHHAWYSTKLSELFIRVLAHVVPPSSPETGKKQNHVPPTLSAFALEPSCIVVASPSSSVGAVHDIAVWDASLGILLGSSAIAHDGSELDSAESTPSKPTKKAVVNNAIQVTVSDDSAFIASIGQRALFLTPVAPRDATLATALGRGTETSKILLHSGNASLETSLAPASLSSLSPDVGPLSVTVAPAFRGVAPSSAPPTIDLNKYLTQSEDTLSASKATSPSSGWLDQGSRESLAASLRQCTAAEAALCASILNPSVCPTAADIYAKMVPFGLHSSFLDRMYANRTASNGSNNSNGTGAPSSTGKKAKKRARSFDNAESKNQQGCTPGRVPNVFVAALVSRLCAELGPASAGTIGTAAATPLLLLLLQRGLISAAASPSLFPSISTVLVGPSAATGTSDDPTRLSAETSARLQLVSDSATGNTRNNTTKSDDAATDALILLEFALLYARDISERVLTDVFQMLLSAVPSRVLARYWCRRVSHSSAGASPAICALLHLVGVAVSCPRNDVFLEKCLRGLDTSASVVLMALLYRFARMHAVYTFGVPLNSAASASGSSHPSATALPLRKEFKKATGNRHPHMDSNSEKFSSSYVPGRIRARPEDAALIATASALQQQHSDTFLELYGPTEASEAAETHKRYIEHIPTYAQVLDWLRILLDAQFARLVVLANAESKHAAKNGAVAGLGIKSLVKDVAHLIKNQLNVCEVAGNVRGQLMHVLLRKSLPHPPEPDYSVDFVEF